MKTLEFLEEPSTQGASRYSLGAVVLLEPERRPQALHELTSAQRIDLLFPEGSLGRYMPLRNLSGEVYASRQFYELDCASYSPINAFKVWGAWNAASSLSRSTLVDHGLTSASAGNHAQGVALAARRLSEVYQTNIAATIFVPTSAAPVKKAAIKEIGGESVQLIEAGNNYDESFEAAQDYMAVHQKPDDTFIHAYDSSLTAEGQGFIGHVLAEKLKNSAVDPAKVYLVVQVGGGGLLGGITDALNQEYPDPAARPKIFIAQLEGADSAIKSHQHYMQSGELRSIAVDGMPNPLADGASVGQIGNVGLGALKYVSGSLLVTNRDLAAAYASAITGYEKSCYDVYRGMDIDPHHGLDEPASMIGFAAGYKLATSNSLPADACVIRLKTGINYNPALVQEIMFAGGYNRR